MKRYCVVVEVKQEHVEEYKEIHRNAWPELLAAIEQAGAKNLIIYSYKNLSIIFYECEDIDRFYEKYSTFEITQKWNDKVHKWFEESPSLDGTGSVDTLEKIFDFRQQLNGKLEQY